MADTCNIPVTKKYLPLGEKSNNTKTTDSRKTQTKSCTFNGTKCVNIPQFRVYR